MKKILLLLLLPILSFGQNCVPTTIIINLDQYQGETSWDVKDSTGLVVADGSGYYSQPDYGIVVEQKCLPAGDLTFTIYDSYGDGLNGALWGGLDGSYYVMQCHDTLIYGTVPNFFYDTTHVLLSAPCPPIFGCMDSSYVEFNPRADTSDGSCLNLIVVGCTDSTMYNYSAFANTMDLIPECDFILTLTDLVGDGWAQSNLEVTQGDSVWNFSLDTAAFSNDYFVHLKSPQPVSFKFSISSQAMQSAAHCGFKLTNPLGQTIIEVSPPFIQPLFKRSAITYCGNLCIEEVVGCLDPLALNYDSLANTSSGGCYFDPGCTNSSYLEYYNQGYTADFNDGSCITLAVWGCNNDSAFNYNPLANIDNGGCIPVILGCMQPLAFNFNSLANTPDTCIALSYGCTDPTMFNFDLLANIDDGSCLPYVFGCTDSTMFNYDPLANANNSSCTPFILGCTDPSMLNYNPLSNTEDFSCIEFAYGCMDTLALNYDSLANTENNSCITVIEGCMDLNAYNYSSEANVNDSSCNYNANCITGPGNPYWLNDPCYAWVISVDDYCCDNEWDDICQLTYDHCDGTYIGPLLNRVKEEKKLLFITDVLGRPTKEIKNKLLFYIYNDGSVEKKLIKK